MKMTFLQKNVRFFEHVNYDYTKQVDNMPKTIKDIVELYV